MVTSNFGVRAFGCEDEEFCGFYMRDEVFNRVVKNLHQTKTGYKPKFGDGIQNLELLNNLGVGVIPPDDLPLPHLPARHGADASRRRARREAVVGTPGADSG